MPTPCQQKPWRCEPRKIRHVAFDADETMWMIHPHVIATSICGPFKLIDPDTLEAHDCSSSYVPSEPAKPKLPEPPASGFYQPYPLEVKYNFATGRYEDVHPVATTPEPDLEEITEALIETLPKKQRHLVDLVDQGKLKLQDLSKSEQAVVYAIQKARSQQALPFGEIPKKAEKPKPKPVAPKPGRAITVKLLPTFRETVDELEKRGISMSVISLNEPGSVKDIMEAFGYADKFSEINDSWRNKGDVIKDTMDRQQVAPCNTLFLDNAQHHVEDATKQCALGLVIGKGQDVEVPIEILNYILDD